MLSEKARRRASLSDSMLRGTVLAGLITVLVPLAAQNTRSNFPTTVSDGEYFSSGRSLAEMIWYAASIRANVTISQKWVITSPVKVPANMTILCLGGSSIKNTQPHGGVFQFDNVTDSSIRKCTIVASAG